MSAIAPRLTRNANGYWDLKLTDGRFEMATDGTVVANHACTRLLMFAAHKDAPSDASLNGEIEGRDDNGTDWYGKIFPTDKSKAEKEFHIKERILGTTGTEKLTDFTWSQDGHTLNITGIVKTIYGEVDAPGVITPL